MIPTSAGENWSANDLALAVRIPVTRKELTRLLLIVHVSPNTPDWYCRFQSALFTSKAIFPS